MQFRDMTYAEAEAAYLVLQAENETLKARVAELEARLGVRTPAPVELNHFATLAELEAAGESAWERVPEEEAMLNDPIFAMQVQANLFSERVRANGWHLPFRNVIVDELDAEVARMAGTGWDAANWRGGNANDDCSNIINLRVLNLTNPIWMRLVQPNDDKWEGDLPDQEELMARYATRVAEGAAGTRVHTKSWEAYPQYRRFLTIFREIVGGDYDPGNPKRPIIPVSV